MSSASEKAFTFRESSFIVYDELDFIQKNPNKSVSSFKDSTTTTNTKIELNALMEEATNEFDQFELTFEDTIPMENVELEHYRDTLLREELLLNCELKKTNSIQQQLNEPSFDDEHSPSTRGDTPTFLLESNNPNSIEKLLMNNGWPYDLSYLTVGGIIREKLKTFCETHADLNIGYFTAIASDNKYYLYIGTNTGIIIVIYYHRHATKNDKTGEELSVRKIQLLFDPNYNMSVNIISLQSISAYDNQSLHNNADDTESVLQQTKDQSCQGRFSESSTSDVLSIDTSTTTITTPTTNMSISSTYKFSNLLHKNKNRNVKNPHYIVVLYENNKVVIWDTRSRKIVTKLTPKNFTDNPTTNQIVMYDKYSIYLSESNGSGYYIKFSQNYKHYRKTLIYTSTLAHTRICPLHFHSKHLKQLHSDPCILAVATSTNIFVVGLNQEKRNIYCENLLKLYSQTYSGGGSSKLSNNLKLTCMEMKWYIQKFSHLILACISNVAIFLVKFEYVGEFIFKDVTIFPAKNTTCFEWINSKTFLRIDNHEDLNIASYNGYWNEQKIRSLAMLKLSHNYTYSPFMCDGYLNVITRITDRSFVILGLKDVLEFTINDDTNRLEYFTQQNSHIKALLMIKQSFKKLNTSCPTFTKEELIQYTCNCLEKYLNDSLYHMRFISNASPFYDNFLKILWSISMYFCTLKEVKSTCFTNIMCKCYQELLIDFTEKKSFLDVILDLVIEKKKIDQVPSLLFDDIKNYLLVSRQLKRFETFILNLNEFPIKEDDPIFTTLINICLYNAYLYIYNQGLHAFFQPLLNLINLIRYPDNDAYVSTPTIEFDSILDAITTNINQNLTSLSNKVNDINVKKMNETFTFILFKQRNSDSRRQEFEHLKILIKRRLTIILDILAVAFTQTPEVIANDNYKTLIIKKNEIIIAIANVMFSDDAFCDNDKSLFYLFLAREIVLSPDSVFINKAIFNRLFDYLTIPNLNRAEDKESILYALFERNYFINITPLSKIDKIDSPLSSSSSFNQMDYQLFEDSNFYPLSVVIKILKKCQYYRLIGLVYEKSQHYEELLQLYFYLNDTKIRPDFNIFSQLKCVFASIANSTETPLLSYQIAIQRHTKKLIEIDLNGTLLFIVECFPSLLESIFQLYKQDSAIYYSILEILFIQIEGIQQNIKIGDFLEDMYTVQLDFFEFSCNQKNESFILNYLKNYHIYTSVEKLIALFQKYNFQYCLMHVYTQIDDFSSVSLIYKNLLKGEFVKLRGLAHEKAMNDYPSQRTETIGTVKEILSQFFGFFSTKFHLFDTDFSWNIWRDIIESCLALLYINNNDTFLLNELGELCKMIFEHMTQYVSIFLILQRILQKQSLYRTIIPKLSIMFTNLTYQKSLNRSRYQLANNIASSEVITWSRRFIQLSKKSFISYHNHCNLCHNKLDYYLKSTHLEGIPPSKYLNQMVFIFECGHWEHKLCFSKHYANLNSTNSKIRYYCSKCYSTQLNSVSYKVTADQTDRSADTIFVDNIVHRLPSTHSRHHSWMEDFEDEVDQFKKNTKNIYSMYDNFIG